MLPRIRRPTNHVPGWHQSWCQFAVPCLIIEEEVRFEFAQNAQLLRAAEEHRIADLTFHSIKVRIEHSWAPRVVTSSVSPSKEMPTSCDGRIGAAPPPPTFSVP